MTKIGVSVEKLRKFCTRSIIQLYSDSNKYIHQIQKSRTKQRHHDGSLWGLSLRRQDPFLGCSTFYTIFLKFCYHNSVGMPRQLSSRMNSRKDLVLLDLLACKWTTWRHCIEHTMAIWSKFSLYIDKRQPIDTILLIGRFCNELPLLCSRYTYSQHNTHETVVESPFKRQNR